jgi:hypothetical protein
MVNGEVELGQFISWYLLLPFAVIISREFHFVHLLSADAYVFHRKIILKETDIHN